MAEWVVFSVLAYALTGLIFSLFFLSWGIQRLDAQTAGTGIGFRLIILPGVVALWPVLLKRWISRS